MLKTYWDAQRRQRLEFATGAIKRVRGRPDTYRDAKRDTMVRVCEKVRGGRVRERRDINSDAVGVSGESSRKEKITRTARG